MRWAGVRSTSAAAWWMSPVRRRWPSACGERPAIRPSPGRSRSPPGPEPPAMPSAAIVINRTLVRDLGRFRRWCREAATASGWEPTFLETTVDERGLGLARGAVAAGARMVVAAGGDGTVRACAQALAGTQVPLAIVPLGTANLAARALGVPSRVGGALAAGFGGHERRIDLAAAEVATGAATGDDA